MSLEEAWTEGRNLAMEPEMAVVGFLPSRLASGVMADKKCGQFRNRL
jgi:hypothetical protein